MAIKKLLQNSFLKINHHTFLRFSEFAKPPPRGCFRFIIEEIFTGCFTDSFAFTTSSYVYSMGSASPSSGALVASSISQSSSLQSSMSSWSFPALIFLTGSTDCGVSSFKLNLSTELFLNVLTVAGFTSTTGFASTFCF